MVGMKVGASGGDVRRFRNESLYRSLTRTLRIYNRRVVDGLWARGFTDFTLAFPQILSNLDLQGTRIGILAERAGVTRQAAGQLVNEIERCGYVQRKQAPEDARATVVQLTAKGRRLIAAILELAAETEASFGQLLSVREFDRVRTGLVRIADAVDPIGAFGVDDD
jgi:DNA-binding MarR family transcriptional regulator